MVCSFVTLFLVCAEVNERKTFYYFLIFVHFFFDLQLFSRITTSFPGSQYQWPKFYHDEMEDILARVRHTQGDNIAEFVRLTREAGLQDDLFYNREMRRVFLE